MTHDDGGAREAVRFLVRGRVQGVGFRPFVFRLARRYGIGGWVRNSSAGVEIHAEGSVDAIDRLVVSLRNEAPPASRIETIERRPTRSEGNPSFRIISSRRGERTTIRVSPDLPVCERCLGEMRDSGDRRFAYAYVNCTECGPRYSIIESLPYDRSRTTMRHWDMCPACAREYHTPKDRRFHAQPIACPECGPAYRLVGADGVEHCRDSGAIREAAAALQRGQIIAVKGIGGYHLACDAENPSAVSALRSRKYRKEKPFALLVRDLATAELAAELSDDARGVLQSPERPIVIAPARVLLEGVAPHNRELGMMLPYAPVHYLLFDAGAPRLLVMTSANRSSEPIAFEDGEALRRLSGMADFFLMGERPIARSVEDSVVRMGPFGGTVIRRSRGYAPAPACVLPRADANRPILAVGADLKNAITLVVEGQAYVSQHIGDLEDYKAAEAFRKTVDDLIAMYGVRAADACIAHDLHPEYRSTAAARDLGTMLVPVQHHEAHVASVLAEHGLWDEHVVGVSFDGTGYGVDGAIWGGEVFTGSLRDGFVRAAHVRQARLPGGDAATRHPVQAAAGFLELITDLPDLTAAPFEFPDRYRAARAVLESGVRVFPTTSMGRLFDTAAAIVGFTRSITFEGQAAIWLEQLAATSGADDAYPFPGLDYVPLLQAVVGDRLKGRPAPDVARSFHLGIAKGLAEVVVRIADREATKIVVASGGVFQNNLLLGALSDYVTQLAGNLIRIATNRSVPPNDGGISLGQAAIAAARSAQ